MEGDQVLSLNRSESLLTNPPGHLWRDKWTALSGPLSQWRNWGARGRINGSNPFSPLQGYLAHKKQRLPMSEVPL